MSDHLYQKLARHLDNLPGGFPSTKSGVELKILRRLFNSEEAEMALHLTTIPEEADVIAYKAKMQLEKTCRMLEIMSKKGLIYRIKRPGKKTRYMASQFVIGIWEFHVNDLDIDLIRDMNEYLPTLFKPDDWNKAPQLRTVPVKQSIPTNLEILPHEHVEKLLEQQKKFLVAPCICRREHRMIGKGCNKPEESCLVVGNAADYYAENGLGRMISQEEAIEIIQQADRSGLVLQTSNSKKIVNICCCCGCCCQVLKNFKHYPKPAELISSPFTLFIDASLCESCGICTDRCQMGALTLDNGTISLNRDRCIGCGLCVSTCPSKALKLIRKPENKQKYVPRNMVEALYNLAKKRGKINSIHALREKLKSSQARRKAARHNSPNST